MSLRTAKPLKAVILVITSLNGDGFLSDGHTENLSCAVLVHGQFGYRADSKRLKTDTDIRKREQMARKTRTCERDGHCFHRTCRLFAGSDDVTSVT